MTAMSGSTDEDLLGPESLKGLSVGVSVSESADLARMGLLEGHFRLALAEIARTVLVSGGCLYYGGHLRPDGYTVFLLEELQKYGRRDKPLKVCLNWAEHKNMSKEQIADQRELMGLFGELVFLDRVGNPLAQQDLENDGDHRISDEERAQSLTGLRRYLAKTTDARVLLGGKRTGFQGAMPGLVEEMICSIETGQPAFLAGGFGGVTLDILRVISPELVEWWPFEEDQPDERTQAGLDAIRDAASASDWQLVSNGLSEADNAILAATYRPSEIAALIGIGLGRNRT